MNVVDRPFRRLLSKVPEVTVYFWIIKVLSTTVGEAFADFVSDTLGLGLMLTTAVTTFLLAAALVAHFRLRRYVAGMYWLVVVLMSIVGTQISDNLVDNLGVSLAVTTVGFAVALSAAFAIWYSTETTLSIHTIDTPRREALYWLAVLFTFALGTAGGDLTAEALGLGYAVTAGVFAALLVIVGVARRCGLGSVLTFWTAYVLTRPLGATLGNLLSQPPGAGGLGLGVVVTSLIFLGTIVAVVAYLSRSKMDRPSLGVPPWTGSRAW